MRTPGFEGLTIIDADTHLTEPHDLWTARPRRPTATACPRCATSTGDRPGSSTASRSGAPARRRRRARRGQGAAGMTFLSWGIEDIHTGAHCVPDRLQMMDEQGIWAEIVYPNTVGFGGQRFGALADPALRRLAVEIYNDAMAEIQEQSGGRWCRWASCPSGTSSWRCTRSAGWHSSDCTASTPRPRPTSTASPTWARPLGPGWEAASDLGLPVNFHIGASDSDMSWFGTVSWPSLKRRVEDGFGARRCSTSTTPR